MPLDVDAVAGQEAVKQIEKLLGEQPHMEREAIADDIIDFAKKLKFKYGKKEPDYDLETLKKVVNQIFACKDGFDEDHKTYDKALEDGAKILQDLLDRKIRIN